MSYEEADRVGLIRAVVEKRMRQREAAKRLGIGVRQVKRLVRRYRSAGPAGLVSRHRGKRPNNAIGEGVRREVLALVVSGVSTPPGFQREIGVKAQGSSRSISEAGWPLAMASSVAFR